MSSIGGYGANVLVEVEEIEYGLGGIKRFSEVILFCDHVFVFYFFMVGV